jgi:hypothetical protein
MITESTSCVSDCGVGADLNTNVLIDNLLGVNTSNEMVKKSDTAIRDIQLDLASFTFGLSELYMLADEKNQLGARIILLKKCVENTISKVDRLAT